MKGTTAWHIVRAGIAIDVAYPLRGFIWLLQSLLWGFMFGSVWVALYDGRETIAGLTQVDIMTYFMSILILEYIAESYVDQELNGKIRDGDLSSLLLKPINIVSYFYWNHIGYRFSRILMYLVMFALASRVFHVPLSLPHHASTWFWLVVSIGIGHLMEFNIKFILGCVTFWFEDTEALGAFYWFITGIPAGWIAPLVFLPAIVQHISTWLPFQYVLYFPTMIFLEKLPLGTILQGCGIAATWLLIIMIMRKYILRKAIHHYNAVGQ